MLRQAKNEVFIEGILSEINLKTGSYDKGGVPTEYVGGDIKVKVSQKIGDQEKELEIPISLFSTKITKNGNPNPSYESICHVMNDYVSIAAAGGEEGADRVRISKAVITQNEYYDQNQNLISYPRIRGSFVNKIKASDCKPKAEFEVELIVAKKEFEVDNQGIETGRYTITGIIPQYGGKVDLVKFHCVSKGVIDATSQYWTEQCGFNAKGKLNFSSTTVVKTEEVDFGEPIEKTYTTNVSELIITGGSQTALEGAFAFDNNEVKTALEERKARLEADKAKDRTKSFATPAQDSGFGSDLGF